MGDAIIEALDVAFGNKEARLAMASVETNELI